MGIFDGVSVSTLNTWLGEAQTALHKLSIGAQVVSVRTGDKSVTFTAGETGKLQSYIRSIQTAIAVAEGGPTPKPYSVATWTR